MSELCVGWVMLECEFHLAGNYNALSAQYGGIPPS